jgi:predicted DNA-binding transcriptional regulator
MNANTEEQQETVSTFKQKKSCINSPILNKLSKKIQNYFNSISSVLFYFFCFKCENKISKQNVQTRKKYKIHELLFYTNHVQAMFTHGRRDCICIGWLGYFSN